MAGGCLLSSVGRARSWYDRGRRFDPARRLDVSEVFTVALDLAKVAERVRSPPLTPCPSSPTGRGAAFRARRFRVRIPGGAPTEEHWPSGYGSALLRRTPGDRCEGSSPSCSARGWLADLVRRPVGSRRSRREPWAGSSPAPSAQGRTSRVSDDGSGFESRRAPRGALWVRAPLLPLGMRNPTGDGTGFETRRASRPCRSDSCRIRHGVNLIG